MDELQFKQMFDSLEEPVLFIRENLLIYHNHAYLKEVEHMQERPLPVWSELTSTKENIICILGEKSFKLTKSMLDDGALFFFQSLKIAQEQSSEIYDIGKTNFASTFRDKLGTVYSSVDRLFRRLEEKGEKEDFEDILATQAQVVFSLLRMVRQLELMESDFSKEYPFEHLNFTKLCQNICYETKSELEQEAISFSYDIGEEMLPVYGNSILLTRLIVSLLSNALKFKGEHGAVHVSLTKRNGQLWLSIQQKGKGIAGSRLKTLFSFETPESIPRPKEGSGLDLWLVSKVTRAHGGSIWAGNMPDEAGTEFSLFLPLSKLKDLKLKNKAKSTLLEDKDMFSSVLIGLADALPANVFKLSFEDK